MTQNKAHSFAAKTPEQRQGLARLVGRAAQATGKGQWTGDEARLAGAKGAGASHSRSHKNGGA